MRARPRTWPSIRFRRLSTDDLARGLMPSIYPYGVMVSSPECIVDHSCQSHDHSRAGATAAVLDPVCGMTVDPATTKHRDSYQQHDYFFCSAGCRGKFAADPEKYLSKNSAPAERPPEGTIYTCPMHPEIR